MKLDADCQQRFQFYTSGVLFEGPSVVSEIQIRRSHKKVFVTFEIFFLQKIFFSKNEEYFYNLKSTQNLLLSSRIILMV